LNGLKNGGAYNIILKTLPNIGATHVELQQKRHSIIAEFNNPVLEGKRDAMDEWGLNLLHPDILCVNGDVSIEQVADYLKSDVRYKKIFCTAPAYMSKVAPAIHESEFNLFDDFFFLIDECDKLGNDTDFRPDITLPIDDFFKFKSKSMISATAIIPSDPRFEAEGFKILKVKPTWDYREDLNLIPTNNVLYATIKLLTEKTKNRVFVFCNSTELIHQIITLAKLEERCRVFCAENSVINLKKDHGFTRAQSKLGNFEDVNFLTSRNFSAVDIKLLDEKPDIILVTHVFKANCTMLDPYADSIQIFGRLRNGISSMSHITNFNNKLESKPEEDAKKYAISNIQGYIIAREEKNKAIEKNEGIAIDVFDEILNGKFKKYFKANNKINYYSIDNYLQEQRINGCYRSLLHLRIGYLSTEFFKLHILNDYFFVENDQHILEFYKKENKKVKLQKIAESLHAIENRPQDSFLFCFGENPYDYRKTNPVECEWYDMLKYEKFKELNFEEHKIKAEIEKRKGELLKLSPKIVADVQSHFEIDDNKVKADLENTIKTILKSYGIDCDVTKKDIEIYFFIAESSTTKDMKKCRSWKITGFKEYPKNN
jgi:hypothetical protein